MYPLVSVIIPSHNAGRTLATAIHSILGQTYPRLEIIVVDDNSVDHTKEIISGFLKEFDNIRYYSLPYDDPKRLDHKGKNINAGWLARNYGIREAKGEWITFQDADDASLPSRILFQYRAAEKFNSSHVCIDWQRFQKRLLAKSVNFSSIKGGGRKLFVSTDKILGLVRKTKGPLFSVLGAAHRKIPFIIKKQWPLEPLFFKSWVSYPCAGNCALVKKEVLEKIRFRPLSQRIWPSKRGRGADRDFNFQVAEIFRNSICLKIPLYLWRVKRQNSNYLKLCRNFGRKQLIPSSKKQD